MRSTFYITFLIFATLLVSCLAEDDVFDEPFVEELNLVETSLITSFLNEEFIKNGVNTSECFSFNYPIKIAYNTEQVISITNFDGLEKAAKSQSSNFHINYIVFPITILQDNQEVIIANTNEFNTLFTTCNINTLKDTLQENVGDCFDYKYPISVINTFKNEVTINSSEASIDFLKNENPDYIPSFTFPFTLNDSTIINNYFDLYTVTNACNTDVCPDLSFTKNIISNDLLTYKFSASGAPESRYTWYINDEYVQTGLEGNSDEFLTHEFTENGSYSVCVFVETPDCPLGTETCEEVIIDTIDSCPEITVSREFATTSSTSADLIIANGEVGGSKYDWYIDGELISQDFYSGDDNDVLNYPFDQGTYKVCAFVETPECPNGISECIQVVNNFIINTFIITISTPVQEPTSCNFNLTYDYTVSNENQNKYILEANTTNQNLIDSDYSWSINGDFLNTGKIFNYEFTEVGDYTICVVVETPDCPNGISFCKDFKVENIIVN